MSTEGSEPTAAPTTPAAPSAAITPTPAPAPVSAPFPTDLKEVRIYSHSPLFYWWPVWAVGFLMGLLTLFGGYRMGLVPAGTKPVPAVDVRGYTEPRAALVLPKDADLPYDPVTQDFLEPRYFMAQSKSMGVIFVAVLLLVIVITNVPLRGLWSVVVIIVAALLTVIFALAGWWEHIFHYFGLLAIHINAGGYFTLSSILFALWLVTFLFFDRQVYMVFTPGQFRVREEIGGAETAFDTMGMVIQKHRDDLFRHWILGLGSGDLIVRTSGAQAREFNMHNVLFIGHKLKLIEEMQRDRPVVRGG